MHCVRFPLVLAGRMIRFNLCVPLSPALHLTCFPFFDQFLLPAVPALPPGQTHYPFDGCVLITLPFFFLLYLSRSGATPLNPFMLS